VPPPAGRPDGHAELHGGGDEPLLSAVMEIVLDSSPRFVGRLDDARPGGLKLGRELAQLGKSRWRCGAPRRFGERSPCSEAVVGHRASGRVVAPSRNLHSPRTLDKHRS
jgi:hypothetical protein